MKLFTRSDTGRYREATPGEIIATATSVLHQMGFNEAAVTLQITILDTVGYSIPSQVRNPEPAKRNADEG